MLKIEPDQLSRIHAYERDQIAATIAARWYTRNPTKHFSPRERALVLETAALTIDLCDREGIDDVHSIEDLALDILEARALHWVEGDVASMVRYYLDHAHGAPEEAQMWIDYLFSRSDNE